MKLVYCSSCQDVYSLKTFKRSCLCGFSWGFYLPDKITARIGGTAIPLGFDNNSFAEAYRKRPKEGLGSRFEAFFIPEVCETVKENE